MPCGSFKHADEHADEYAAAHGHSYTDTHEHADGGPSDADANRDSVRCLHEDWRKQRERKSGWRCRGDDDPKRIGLHGRHNHRQAGQLQVPEGRGGNIHCDAGEIGMHVHAGKRDGHGGEQCESELHRDLPVSIGELRGC